MPSTPSPVLAVVALVAFLVAPHQSDAADRPTLTLERGDRICLIGNTLPERMQHFGYFEALLHASLPEHALTVRNLAWSADELTLRPRPGDFGSTDHHLARQDADVVLAFFGFNEAFAGEEGLGAFRDDLSGFVTHTRDQRYNFDGPGPRLVLVSPIAAEEHADNRLASADRLNARLEMYTDAMRQVAGEHDIPFVDLFTPTRRMFAQADKPLTINGIHLNEAGYRSLAPVLLAELLGEPERTAEWDEHLRREILARNADFFYAYRPANAYYIHGGRSQLSHEPDTSFTNADVMARERAIFEQMAANRDRRIWRLARGEAVPEDFDHADLPPQYEIASNFTEPFEYLYGDDALETFTLPEGYAINLFACEQRFPELANPVAINFDGQGRLWVSTMPLFPQRRPDQEPEGKLLVFEDTDGDGTADTMTVFADGLHVVTGFELGDGGVYVAAQPHLKFLADTTGDGKADVREPVLHGFDSADCHHAISSFAWGPEGALYFQEGIFQHTQVETPRGPTRLREGGVFRYVPQRHELDVFIGYRFVNPWGHVFDRWGMNIVSDGTGPDAYYAGLLSGRLDYPDLQQPDAPHFSVGVRPNAANELISSRHFPDDAQGHYLQTNVTVFHGIRQFELLDDGAGLNVEHVQDLLLSTDLSFRPIDMKFGPDGALYVSDFYSRLIGHMTHSLRDPNRDQKHGRIYRITRADRPLLEPEPIAGRSIRALLDLLKAPEDRTVYRARRELREHDDAALLAALDDWKQNLDADHPEHERHLLEVLWLSHARGELRQGLLERLLQADNHRARAAATRALRHNLHRVDEPYALVEQQINDSHPRVRLEAVIAVSFLEGDRARDLADVVQDHPMDRHLDYALDATRRALE